MSWLLLAVHGSSSVPAYPASHGCVREFFLHPSMWRYSVKSPFGVAAVTYPPSAPPFFDQYTSPLALDTGTIAGLLPALDAWRRMIVSGPTKFG